jgi:hypothetical protein
MAFTGDKGRVMKSSTQGDTLSGGSLIGYLRWVGGSAGNTLSVTSSGDEIFYSKADADDFIDVHPLFQPVRNLTIATMGGGTLYVYFL